MVNWSLAQWGDVSVARKSKPANQTRSGASTRLPEHFFEGRKLQSIGVFENVFCLVITLRRRILTLCEVSCRVREVVLTLFQHLLASLHGSCVQHCKLHYRHSYYCLGVIYAYFHKERSAFPTFSTTRVKIKTSKGLPVKQLMNTSCWVYVRCRSPKVISSAASRNAMCREKVKNKDNGPTPLKAGGTALPFTSNKTWSEFVR